MTRIYRRFSFIPDVDSFRASIKYNLLEDELCRAAESLVSFARSSLEPSLTALVADVESFDPTSSPVQVKIGGTVFSGRILQRLEGVRRAALYCITAGDAFSAFDFSAADPLAVYFAEELKSQALGQARKASVALFRDLLSSPSVSSLNPGSGDAGLWPITDLKPLFSLLQTSGCRMDVTLTDTCLMVPCKSIAGIFYPDTEEFFTCSECTRTNCPSRGFGCTQ